MTICKTLLSKNVWHLYDGLKPEAYYDLYIGGGLLFLDTGDAHVRFALGSGEVLSTTLERPVGRWVSIDLDVEQCDPRLQFPVDYFIDSMYEEYKELRRELGDCLDERIEELYDQAMFGPS